MLCAEEVGKNMQLPFKCSRCECEYTQFSKPNQHLLYKQGGEKVCFLCRFECASDVEKAKMVPELTHF